MTEVRRHRALITRPQEDAADVAVALARRGITPVLAPMMRIVHLDEDIGREVESSQALLFTSRNGVRAFARLSTRRDLPVFAVGDSTAALARDTGFLEVHSASGDSDDLARLVIDALNPSDGSLFHAAGETVAGSLFERLTAAGFVVVRRTLYDAVPVDQLPPEIQAALQRGTLDYVLLFSPRTARIFVERVRDAELDGPLKQLVAVCLSPAVAGALDAAAWRAVEAAPAPTTAALVSVLDRLDKVPTSAPPASAAPPPLPVPPADAASEAVPADKAVEPAPETGENPTGERLSPAPLGGPWELPESLREGPQGARSDVPPPARGWVEAVTTGGFPAEDSGGSPPQRRSGSPQREEGTAPADDEQQGVAMTERAEEKDPVKPAPKPLAAKKPGEEPLAAEKPGEESPAANKPVDEPPAAPKPAEASPAAKPAEPLPEFLSAKAASPAPRRRGSTAGVAWTLVVVLVGLGAAYYTLPQWRDRLPEPVRARLAGATGDTSSGTKAEIAALRSAADTAKAALADAARRNEEASARLAVLEQRAGAADALTARLAAAESEIAALKATPPQQGGGPAAAALVERLSKLEAALEAAGKARSEATATAAESERLRVEQADKAAALAAGLQGRIAALEDSLKETRKAAAASGHADALALAVGQLREALSRSAPFVAELSTLEKVAGDAPALQAAIAPVRAYADKGIPTRSELFVRLPDVVDAAVAASKPAPDPGVAGRIAAKFRDFVSVRRIDGKGSDAEARIARAEMAAGRGDLAAAAAELSALQGPSAEAVAPWLGDAKARLAADDATATLGRRLLAGAAGETGK